MRCPISTGHTENAQGTIACNIRVVVAIIMLPEKKMSITVKIHIFLVIAELQSNTNYILRLFFGIEGGGDVNDSHFIVLMA